MTKSTTPPEPADIDERVRAQVEAIRASPELAARYDVTGDGVIDDAEWALIERMVRLEVETRLGARATGSHRDLTVLSERFEVIGLLGRGGQGITHLAIDRKSGDHVVVKELSLRGVDDWKAVELFEREGELLESVEHARIPSYIDAFTVEDDDGHRFFLVQEYVFGVDLETSVAQQRWDPEEALERLNELAEILAFLHRLTPPIIHRDVKPSNIIVAEETGHLHLVDFGAAQSIVSETRMGSTMVGTSGYIPMEQYVGRAAPAADIYAAGATILHAVTGVAPIDLAMHKGKLDFHALIRDDRLRRVLDAMLEPFPEDRIADGGALVDRLSKSPATTPSVAKTAAGDSKPELEIQTPAPRSRPRETKPEVRSGALVAETYADSSRTWLEANFNAADRSLTRTVHRSKTPLDGIVITTEPHRVRIEYVSLPPGGTSAARLQTFLLFLMGLFLSAVALPIGIACFFVGAGLLLWSLSKHRRTKIGRDEIVFDSRTTIPTGDVHRVTVSENSVGFHHGSGAIHVEKVPGLAPDSARYLEAVLNDAVRRLAAGEELDPSDVW